MSPLSSTLAGISFTTAPPGEPLRIYLHLLIPFSLLEYKLYEGRVVCFVFSDIIHIPASEQAFNMFTVLMNRFVSTLMLCNKTFQSRRQILANITHLPCVRCSTESFTYIISFNLPQAFIE